MKVIALLLCLLSGPAFSQTGSQKTPVALATETNTLLGDNTTNQITAFDFRQTILDIIASYNALSSGVVRINLTTNTTFFVSTTGNDSNGCTSSVADACLTIQHAYDVLANSYDLNGFTATIQVANGTYTGGLITSKCVPGANGPGSVVILGSATPSNVVISVTSKDAFGIGEIATGAGLSGCTQLTIGGMKLQTTSSGNAVNVSGGGSGVVVGTAGFPIEFGATALDHIVGNHSAWIVAGTNNLVSGGANIHVAAISNAVVALHNTTETLSNTPAFTIYAYADTGGDLYMDGMTFAGTGATGTRFDVLSLGMIYTLNDSATYIPGNSTGAEALGGRIIKATVNQWSLSQGGTNADLSATGGTSQVLQQVTSGAPVTVGRLALSDLSNTTAQIQATLGYPVILGGSASAVNLNSANTDTAITITSPTANYKVDKVTVFNTGTTASLTTATVGLFTAAGGGGLALAANQALSAITANSINTDANSLDLTTTVGSRTTINSGTLQFRVGSAQGASATGNVYIWIRPQP